MADDKSSLVGTASSSTKFAARLERGGAEERVAGILLIPLV